MHRLYEYVVNTSATREHLLVQVLSKLCLVECKSKASPLE